MVAVHSQHRSSTTCWTDHRVVRRRLSLGPRRVWVTQPSNSAWSRSGPSTSTWCRTACANRTRSAEGRQAVAAADPRQGLVRHIEQAPWIPNEDVWQRILAACTAESLRNRLRVTLAYDGALRREELVQLDVEDFEPAHRLIHLWAEATKSQRAREVAFGTTSSQLFAACPRERRTLFGRIDGPLFRSTSNRNWVAPLGASSWSKTVEGIARRAGAPNSPDRPSPRTHCSARSKAP
ncbi:tyrosine-type recombinase/integrase [Streptomyces sp. NBC_00481]|uniref:tyrosine-type recombinase/integrase n=1 Tax=Streptomyces sp. NBC_00481 TaxID=2975755 RepID=UPI003FA3BE42